MGKIRARFRILECARFIAALSGGSRRLIFCRRRSP